MGLATFVRNELVDVIEWAEPGTGVLACRFPLEDREIRPGAVLTVREAQMAAFMSDGRVTDVLGPGVHRLTARSLPVLDDLRRRDGGVQSPFRSDVYFFSTRLHIAPGWGTATPISVRDPEWGVLHLRAHGAYAYRIADPRTFHVKVSGARARFLASELEEQVRGDLVARVAEVCAESGVPLLHLAADHSRLAQLVIERAAPAFTGLGLTLESFAVQSLSLPVALQKRLDERLGATAGTAPQARAAQSSGAVAASPGPAPHLGAAAEKFCIGCGRSIPPLARFCPDCGVPQRG